MKDTHIIGQCRLKPATINRLVGSTLELERIKSKVIHAFPKAQKDISRVIDTLINIAKDEGISTIQWKQAARAAISLKEMKDEIASADAEETAGQAET